MKHQKALILTAVLAILLVGAWTVLAQPCMSGKQGRGFGGQGKGMGCQAVGECPMGMGAGQGLWLKGLTLSADQKTQIAAIVQKNAAAMKTQAETMAAERENIATIMFADTLDEAALRQAIQKASLAKEEMLVVRAKQLAEIKQVLTPAQIDQLKQQRAERRANREFRQSMRQFDRGCWMNVDPEL